ncbi:unnamed protein product [Ectocarpus sp. CCAP 1310/34]|nr:unnamed protein product [Ectocarpus sp. CCAP 1310/34]
MWEWLPSLELLAGGGSATRLTPPYISSLDSLPMAETGVGDALLPATALAVVLVALDEVQRNDLSQEEEEDRAPDLPRPKLSRGQRKRKDVEKCAWAKMLEDKDLEDSNSITSKQFRLDFRVPYSFFLRLGALVKSKDWFTTSGCDAAGRQSHQVEHKVLAWLTILGRGNCFASIYQMSWMSGKTVQTMFHKFRKHFAREMYDEHIYLPSEQNGELDHVMEQCDRLGFLGAMSSMGVTVNHAGRAIVVTEGFTGSTNDKTIICWDAAVEKIRTDKQYPKQTFDVYNEDGTTTTLKGCYLLVDNGYHKDPELAMAYHEQERIDNVFLTCCILHNTLHTFDRMDQLVENTLWASSAGAGTGVATEQEADSSSIGAKDTNDKEQVEKGHGERKRKLTTSFAYRMKHKKDIVWLSR